VSEIQTRESLKELLLWSDPCLPTATEDLVLAHDSALRARVKELEEALGKIEPLGTVYLVTPTREDDGFEPEAYYECGDCFDQASTPAKMEHDVECPFLIARRALEGEKS
jgi:hypothetical protein